MIMRYRMALILVFGWNSGMIIAEGANAGDTGLSNENLITEPQLSVVEDPKNVTVLRGSPIELRCEVFGTPVPTMQWLHNGKPVKMIHENEVNKEKMMNRDLRTFQMTTISSKLHIPCMDSVYAGVYTCQASNGLHTVQSNATVTVQKKDNTSRLKPRCPRIRSSRRQLRSPAHIYMWTASRMERPGASVQLMCRANGVPKPSMIWFERFDGHGQDGRTRVPIKANDDRFELLSNGDLVIKTVPDGAPLRVYECDAVNELGRDSENVVLLGILDDTEEMGVTNN